MVSSSEAKLTNVYDPLNLNHVKGHEAISVSYAHIKRDSSNTMQLLEVFATLDGGV